MYSTYFNPLVVDAASERREDPTVGIFHNYTDGTQREVIGIEPERLRNLYRINGLIAQLVQAIETGEIALTPITMEGEILKREFTRITDEVLKVG